MSNVNISRMMIIIICKDKFTTYCHSCERQRNVEEVRDKNFRKFKTYG